MQPPKPLTTAPSTVSRSASLACLSPCAVLFCRAFCASARWRWRRRTRALASRSISSRVISDAGLARISASRFGSIAGSSSAAVGVPSGAGLTAAAVSRSNASAEARWSCDRGRWLPGSENGVDGAPRPRPPSAPPASSAASVGSIGAGLTAR